MALPPSGALSINDIVGEFGGTAPHSLSEYYRGGGLVPDTAANSNIPTSGAISISNFYGAQNSLWVTTMTAGYFTTNFPSNVYMSGYSDYDFGGYGSLSDYSVDFYGTPNTCTRIFTQDDGGGNSSLWFAVAGNRSNSDWTSMTVSGLGTYNRSAATFIGYDSGTGDTTWTWSAGGSYFTPGSQYTITFL